MSHRDPVECSGLLTHLRLTHYGYRLTVLRNDVSDTTVVVSTRRRETFTDVNNQTFISFFKQPAAARPKGLRTGGK